ncbi:MAG: hypothetical protein MJ252_17385, partial [archaeon]|nr:hypothetical protein [archaeon]
MYSENEKASLINSLEKRGLLDTTKAYLRSNLYESLKNAQAKGKLPQQNPDQDNLKSFNFSQNKERAQLTKISMTLIIDFLTKNGLNYSLSVFQNEAKGMFQIAYPFSEGELISLLNIDVKALEEYKDQTGYSYLNQILLQSTKSLYKHDNEMQTDINLLNNPIKTGTGSDTTKNYISIEDKLNSIDKKYEDRISIEKLLPTKRFEERYQNMKKEMEAKYKEDLEMEMKRFKQIELSQMRIEENK